MKTMTLDDFIWLMSLVEDGNVCTECDIFDKCQEENRWLMSLVEDGNVCTECDIFDKCQEENRNFCEKEQTDENPR